MRITLFLGRKQKLFREKMIKTDSTSEYIQIYPSAFREKNSISNYVDK